MTKSTTRTTKAALTAVTAIQVAELHDQGQATKSSAGAFTMANPAAGVTRETKQSLLVSLLRRREGATIPELSAAIGWQAHSVRGAISCVVKKKLGLPVTSAALQDRGRVYRIAVPVVPIGKRRGARA